jgi:hypothetical protein
MGIISELSMLKKLSYYPCRAELIGSNELSYMACTAGIVAIGVAISVATVATNTEYSPL